MARLAIGLALGVALLATGCGETRQAAPVARSGFLAPEVVARLRPAEDGARVFAEPGAGFRRYTRVPMDPVRILSTPGGVALTEAQRRQVTGAVREAFLAELGRDCAIATQPGPGTIRVSAALSEVRAGADPAIASATTFMPLLRPAREGVALAGGSNPLTGGAAGAQLRTTSLDDVAPVATCWAQLTAQRLCLLQERPGCTAGG